MQSTRKKGANYCWCVILGSTLIFCDWDMYLPRGVIGLLWIKRGFVSSEVSRVMDLIWKLITSLGTVISCHISR